MRFITLLTVAALALAADKPEKGFKALFNGKNLAGWTKAKENEGTFRVEDGAIIANGPRCHLYYTGKDGKASFTNFELKVDVMTKNNSNGGIYFHTAYQEKNWPDKGFEVQVNNTFEKDFRKTAGLYMVPLLSKTGMEKMTHAANEDLWVSGTGVLRLRSASLG